MTLLSNRRLGGFFVFAFAVLGADACETMLELASAVNRGRAVAVFGVAGSQLGFEVRAAGDLNGDGYDDFAVAAPSGGAANEGDVFVVFGRDDAPADWEFNFSASAAATPADPPNWIRIRGGQANMNIGWYGIAAGDFNGDGFDDLLVSSIAVGTAFCVFGRAGAWSSFSTEEIGNSSSVPGFIVTGFSSTSYMRVGNAGDMNGDGIEDLLVSVGGTACVVFGEPGSNRSAISLYDLDGSNGFSLSDDTTTLSSGGAMGSAGDVNGDGLADLVIGSYGGLPMINAGRAFVLFARNVSATGQQWSSQIALNADLDGTNGFIVEGSSGTPLGFTVFGAGDVNADGFDDIIIGAHPDSDAGAWVVLGHAAPWTSPLSMSLLNGTNGFHFESSNDYWGVSCGSAGDVNGDGFDDVVIGGFKAYNSLAIMTGFAAILFGHSGPWPAIVRRNDVAGSMGFLIEGPSQECFFGYSSHAAGDVNGDGLSDFVVGAYNHDSESGYAALVFGVPDDHCAVCSNTTDACLVCDDGFSLNGTICEFMQNAVSSSSTSSSSSPASSSSSSSFALESSSPAVFSSAPSSSPTAETRSFSSSSSSSSSDPFVSVVVINFDEDVTDPTELQEEIASVLGIDSGLVSVVVISPTEVEVTIIGSEETAQRLVDIVDFCKQV